MLLVGVVVVAAGLAGWTIEPSFTGEEALDFTSISRFADGGAITLRNASLLPDAGPVYLVPALSAGDCHHLGLVRSRSAGRVHQIQIVSRTADAGLRLQPHQASVPSRIEARAAFIVGTHLRRAGRRHLGIELPVSTGPPWGVGAGICMPA